MRIFMAPGLYVQGPHVLEQIGPHAATFGRSALLICDAFVRPLIEDTVVASLKAAGMNLETLVFSGDVTEAALAELHSSVSSSGADLIIGAGGGRALDAAKGAALNAALPVISVPTIASTDAPASRGVPVLGENHQVLEVRQLPRNPDVVLVDTALIAKAPMRFLAAGIGDALSSYYEAEACFASEARNKHGTRPLLSGRIIARGCFETIRRDGTAALVEIRMGTPGTALENTVEAIILMSCMAFENTSLAIAHSIAPALASLGNPNALHGEHAAYGTLVQVVFENRPDDEALALLDFCRQLGLPTSIEAFRAEMSMPDFIARVAEQASRSRQIDHQPGKPTAAKLAEAMWKLETIVADSDKARGISGQAPTSADLEG